VAYTVQVPRRVLRDVERLPAADARRILVAIKNLETNPRPPGCIKLTGQPAWRVRVGQYRIVYEIEDSALVVRVIEAGNRRDVYR
jgi:mRNA interferase RelE/StbE